MKRLKKRDIPPVGEISDDAFVDEFTAAKVIGMSVYWMRKRREPQYRKQGPPWIKTNFSVRYSVKQLREWMRRQAVNA